MLIRSNRSYRPIFVRCRLMGTLIITKRFIFATGKYATNYAI